jgi:glycogen debranching enzyme
MTIDAEPLSPSGEAGAVQQEPAEDLFYIQATASPADEVRRVLKDGETFAVFDRYGDIRQDGIGEDGLYHEGTRFLSCLLLRLVNTRPLFLNSTVRQGNDLLAVDLTNPDISAGEQIVVPRGTLYISRTKFLWRGACHERFRFHNYGLHPIAVTLFLYFNADFADIFEVRGTRRARRGTYHDPAVEDGCVTLSYEGLDGMVRQTRLEFSPPPAALTGSSARLEVSLSPHQETSFFLSVTCSNGDRRPVELSYEQAFYAAAGALHASQVGRSTLETSSSPFNEWLNRASSDLRMMTTETPQGPYPYAGVPWFSTAFGRDGIITALECLWIDPSLARGVLGYLAANQADLEIPEQDAEPGKILHETRGGEMAALGEIPFGRYYGSVDATPLFIMLLGAYLERTGDLRFIEALWPNLQRALNWIDRYGDRDGDGLVEFERHCPRGLVQQGWKDSFDSVFHEDGSLARGPIALCEVQGYVFAARTEAARIAVRLGHKDRAEELLRQAEALRARFEETFWCEDLSTYALALDGDKRPCRVRASNAGHCLLTGIAAPERARRVARTLLQEDSFSGWGIRTVSAVEARYNPMAYHNGSVWPHDNALIAAGFARYGLRGSVLPIMTGLFEVSRFVDLQRLPELFCGFDRRPGEGPTLYPVACAPQSWAAASVLMLLQACLGLHIDGTAGRISFTHPRLPEFLQEVWVRNLRVGNAVLDLLLVNHRNDVGIHVQKREGEVEIVTVK